MLRHTLVLVSLASLVGCSNHATPASSSRAVDADPPNHAEAPAPTNAACAATPLTVVSYNVNYGLASDTGPVDQATLRQIEDLLERADVIAFQETTDAWERAIRAASKRSHPHASFHAPGRFIAGGIGIVSKFPIEAEDLLPSPVDWFPAQRVELGTPDGRVQLLNVHLRPMISESGSWVSGYFTTGHFRMSEATSYVERLTPDLPTIVLGDFNEEDPGGALSTFEALGLVNAVSIREPSATTWRWTASSIPLALRLDHVLYPKATFELRAAKVHAGGTSDHLPVEVELARRCEAPEGSQRRGGFGHSSIL